MANTLIKSKPRILIISPVYNESEGIIDFVKALESLKNSSLSASGLRLILVDDGSKDNSFEKMQLLSEKYEWVRCRRLTGNFGHQAAIIAGLSCLKEWDDNWSDVIITMDSDLEHPPEVVPRLIEAWESKRYSVVHAIREENKSLPLLKRLFSKLFYLVANKLTGLKIQSGQADFSLWDANLVKNLYPYLKHIGSLRIFGAWLPGEKCTIKYSQNLRKTGRSNYDLNQSWNLAINSITKFSSAPLRLISFIGGAGLSVSVLYFIWLGTKFANHEYFEPDIYLIVITIVFVGSFQALFLGILASYFRRLVFSKDLPLFVVKHDIRFNQSE